MGLDNFLELLEEVKETGRPWMKWRISPSLLTKVKED